MMISDDSRKWWILGAMGGVMGLILLDETVVGVALPTIRKDLGLSVSLSHWVINAYLLVFTGLAAVGGKLGDIFGIRNLFALSMLVFGAASFACGFSDSGAEMVTARIFQGAGAAIIFPISLAMITITFPAGQRGLALGIYGAVGTFFLGIGPLVGGFFTDLLSWRWIFWINIPVMIAIAVIVLSTWRDIEKNEETAAFDYPGLLTLIGGLGLIIFALMQGPDWGWTSPLIIGMALGGIGVICVFVHLENRKKSPLMELDLFNNGTFSVCNFVIFIAQFNQMCIVIFGALYLQDVLNLSPLMTGVILLAAVGMAPLTGTPTGMLVDRIGARPVLLISLILTVFGMLWVGYFMTGASYVYLIPGFIAWGITNCALFIAGRRPVMASVPPEKHGQAGGILMTSQLLGGTVSVAIGGVLFALTGNYAIIFTVAAAITAVGLIWAWFSAEKIVSDS
ncbi:MAG: MFS transporter [Sneathiella sp.]